MSCTRILAAALLASSLYGQVAREANSTYETESDRKSIAAGLADPNRDERQKPRELVEAMGLARGMSVADVGTGIGYMLPFLSHAVGRIGRVYAEDIFDDFLAAAKQRAENLKLTNVTFVKGTENDPMLPAGQLDAVLLLDVYHHLDYPDRMLAAIHKALRPEGKLVIVEYFKSPTSMPGGRAMRHIRLDQPDVIKEIEANHFHLVSEREQVQGSQYMLILTKN
jgi:ubiquinone/menaquinone biosynthesis C-methylase UbiE